MSQHFTLFFNGQWPELIAILQEESLDSLLPKPTPQQLLLHTLLDPLTKPDSFKNLFQLCSSSDDWQGCCACVGGALAAIWEEGNDFHAFSPWLLRADELLREKELIPPAARSFLLLQKGIAEMTGPGDLPRARQSFLQAQQYAEDAGSPFLRTMSAAAGAYCFTWSGDINRAEILLLDSTPLLSAPDLNPLALLHHQLIFSLVKILQQRPEEAMGITRGIINSPLFGKAPVSLQLLAYTHSLDAAINMDESSVITELSAMVRKLAIPARNNFHLSYLSFILGMASFSEERPHRALVFAEESVMRAERSHSAIGMRMSALLTGRALAENGKEQQALEHFRIWDRRWLQADYKLICALARLETVALHLRQGNPESAKKSWTDAHLLVPNGEPFFALYRSSTFYEKLKEQLSPSNSLQRDQLHKPIKIQTLGTFTMEVNGHKLHDRNWHGKKNKLLLQLIIASGGRKVVAERIAWELWPDADGDLAMNSLYVTLSRLRKNIAPFFEEKLSWLTLENGLISLDSCCNVDALIFADSVPTLLDTPDKSLALADTLTLYRGNFLEQETDAPIIVDFRHRLLNLFTRGVLVLADQTTEPPSPTTISLIERAIEYDPYNEPLYCSLIRFYLATNNRSKAVGIYEYAAEILSRDLNLEPGPVLQELRLKISH